MWMWRVADHAIAGFLTSERQQRCLFTGLALAAFTLWQVQVSTHGACDTLDILRT
jgi:hypothetical protein